MKAPPMTIYLKENTMPLPKSFEDAAQMEMDKHLGSGIMIKCKGPTDWCSLGFFVPIGDGEMSPSFYGLH